jgi:hypothetical protein
MPRRFAVQPVSVPKLPEGKVRARARVCVCVCVWGWGWVGGKGSPRESGAQCVPLEQRERLAPMKGSCQAHVLECVVAHAIDVLFWLCEHSLPSPPPSFLAVRAFPPLPSPPPSFLQKFFLAPSLTTEAGPVLKLEGGLSRSKYTRVGGWGGWGGGVGGCGGALATMSGLPMHTPYPSHAHALPFPCARPTLPMRTPYPSHAPCVRPALPSLQVGGLLARIELRYETAATLLLRGVLRPEVPAHKAILDSSSGQGSSRPPRPLPLRWRPSARIFG